MQFFVENLGVCVNDLSSDITTLKQAALWTNTTVPSIQGAVDVLNTVEVPRITDSINKKYEELLALESASKAVSEKLKVFGYSSP